MKRPASHIVGVVLLLALILLVGQTRPAAACGDGQCGDWDTSTGSHHTYPCGSQEIALARNTPGVMIMRMGDTIITPIGPHRALITVTGYVATSMFSACADGLTEIGGIRRINSSTVLRADTGEALQELDFAASTLTGPDFAAAASRDGLGPQGADWQGFFSPVSKPVPDGTHLTYVFDVTLKPGVRLSELAAALRADGVLGSARANSDGTLNSAHIHLRPLGETPVLVEFPPRRNPQDRPPRAQ